MPRPRRISQQTIARELGVSQALVSLALNGQHERIHPDTYQKIWDHAIKAGYQPKGIKIENSPADTRTRQIGVILRANLNLYTQGSYFNHVMHGLHTAVIERGYTTAFLGSEDSINDDLFQQFFGAGHTIKGVVLMGEVEAKFLVRLRHHTQHIVAVSARHQGFCHSVVGNEPSALEAVVSHLVEHGHRRIGWIGGNVGLGRHEVRHKAFQAALRTADLKHDPRYDALQEEGDRAEGTEAMLEILPLAKRKDFPTAFVTYNIQMAIGAIRALRRAKCHVPADLSIAASDFSQTASKFTPRITSAGCEPELLGSTAAGLAIDQAAADPGVFSDLVLPSKLYLGESTAAVG